MTLCARKVNQPVPHVYECSDLLSSGVSDALAVARTRFCAFAAYVCTMLAPRPRVAPTTSIVDILVAIGEGYCDEKTASDWGSKFLCVLASLSDDVLRDVNPVVGDKGRRLL